jgi:hypothetical protein
LILPDEVPKIAECRLPVDVRRNYFELRVCAGHCEEDLSIRR